MVSLKAHIAAAVISMLSTSIIGVIGQLIMSALGTPQGEMADFV